MPIGKVSLLTPYPSEPLKNTTDSTLSKESSDQTVAEIKHKTDFVTEETPDQLGLINIPPLPNTDRQLPDATVNLIVDLPGVDLPGVDEVPMDVTVSVPTLDEEGEPMDTTTMPLLVVMMSQTNHHILYNLCKIQQLQYHAQSS